MKWIERARMRRLHDDALLEDAWRTKIESERDVRDAQVTARAVGILMAPNHLAERLGQSLRGERVE